MKPYLLFIFFVSLLLVACSVRTPQSEGEPCDGSKICEKELDCVEGVCVAPIEVPDEAPPQSVMPEPSRKREPVPGDTRRFPKKLDPHAGHNHGPNGHGHAAPKRVDPHAGHDHGAHAGHDHGAHAGHDHGAHKGHDHGAHEGHDHGDPRDFVNVPMNGEAVPDEVKASFEELVTMMETLGKIISENEADCTKMATAIRAFDTEKGVRFRALQQEVQGVPPEQGRTIQVLYGPRLQKAAEAAIGGMMKCAEDNDVKGATEALFKIQG